ncbi:MAG: VWA-like domain-containing protein, partial [Eubacterium sp.]|nr:VWA-like domain-containing protein [Eubacterium sp.]
TYIYKRLSVALDMDILTAEGIYKTLKTWDFSDSDFKIMYKAFKTDDHGYWQRPQGGKNPPPTPGNNNDNDNDGDDPTPPDGIANSKKSEDKWKDLSERTASSAEHINREAGEGEGNLLVHLKAVNRRRYDYKEFLRRFAVYGEEVKPDPDSFDPGFYAYGLSLYGNMPIIEPLEFREVKKVSDFVVVIDTSASCSGEAVKGFLSQTFGILNLRNSFFNRVKIHVIQCDNKVRRDTVIENSEQLEKLFNDMELVGFGGTDFRPAFEYVEEIKGSLKNLKGLIYFTDGEGIFPEKPPSYDVAFVFLKEHYYDAEVPSWAVKLILDNEELTNK